jgi:outer membrane phospholipase A
MAVALWAGRGGAEERAYEQQGRAPLEPGTREVPAPGEAGTPTTSVLPEIEPRRGGSNFFLLNVYDGRKGVGAGERGLVRFRLDLEYDIARFEQWEGAGFFYLTFPIRLASFWDLFDKLPGSQSAPFLETNYAPALEASWVAPASVASFWSVRAGVLHESNGFGLVTLGADQLSSSRSWNVVYLGSSLELPRWGAIRVKLDASAWLPFGSERVDAWPNAKDPGTRLEDHIGYGEIGADILMAYPSLRARLREKSVELQIRWPFKRAQVWNGASRNGNGFRLDLLALCHLGKGERLTVANESHYSCYLGVGL